MMERIKQKLESGLDQRIRVQWTWGCCVHWI